LFAWEDELVREFILLLHGVTLQADNTDRWLWTLETSHVFSVRSAYNLLTFQPSTFEGRSMCFRDRLPTNDNLLRRGVIHHDARLCVTHCGFEENLAHLFLHCKFFGSIWHHIYRWMGVSTTIPFSVGDHFNQFTIDGGASRARRSILRVLWYATT